MVSPLLILQSCATASKGHPPGDTSASPVYHPHCTAEKTEAWGDLWVVEPRLASDCSASKASRGRLPGNLVRGELSSQPQVASKCRPGRLTPAWWLLGVNIFGIIATMCAQGMLSMSSGWVAFLCIGGEAPSFRASSRGWDKCA